MYLNRFHDLYFRCSHLIGSDGKPHPFTPERLKEITATVIHEMADSGLRTICIAYKDYVRESVRKANDTTEVCV